MVLKTSTKIIIGVIVFITLIAIYGISRAKKLKAIFESITIAVTSFRNLKVSLKDIRLDVDIEFTNPTTENFNVNGYVVSLSRLNFFYNGKYLATAKPLISEISIPANNKLKISNIPVVLPTSAVLTYASEFLNFSLSKLTVEAVIDVAGTEIFIKQ